MRTSSPGRPGHANTGPWRRWLLPGHGHRPLWSTFLTEQRALLRELDELEDALTSVRAPVLVLADPPSRSTTRRRRGPRTALPGCPVEAGPHGSRTPKATWSASFQPEENRPSRGRLQVGSPWD